MSEKLLFKTNITVLSRVQSYLKNRQKMNDKCTYVILSGDNNEKIEEAIKAVGDAIRLLSEIK